MTNPSRFEFTTRRPVAILMIVIGITVFGVISYNRLALNLMPEITYPSYTIRTLYPGAAPEEVENIVSRPIEEQLGLIKNLVSITSISRPEQSDIILEFTWDVNLDEASQEIRERLDQVQLDRDVERPLLLRYDPSLDPVIRLGITTDLPLQDAREIIEDEVARELETIPGVAAAKVKGGLEKEILIKLDEKQLAISKIPYNLIVTRLTQENINLAGGNIKEGESEFIVRTLNEFQSVEEIKQIIISELNGIPVRLQDIAWIEISHKEREVITRVNGVESIELDIYKEADANIVGVCQAVRHRIFGTPQQQSYTRNKPAQSPQAQSFQAAQMEKQMTDFLSYRLSKSLSGFTILADQSVFIQNSIDEVKNTAIMGGILAIIILYLFLQNFSTTVIVALSIPLSVIATFAPMNLVSISLNIMSLGGLALGIGMLVDNSIVVMESIFRCREEGDNWTDSVVRGVSEVGMAVTASTLTTVAVFFPIVFVEGIAGQIFNDLALTVVFSLIASLLIALYFIPMLASRQFKPTKLAEFHRFGFRFESEPQWKSYIQIPIEAIRWIFGILTGFLFLLGMTLVSVLFALGYPFLCFTAIPNRILPSVHLRIERFQKKHAPLWDNFFTLFPLFHFVTSLNAHTSRWKQLITYPYYLIRLLLETVMFILIRLLMSLLSILILLFKTLFLMLIIPIIPGIHAIARIFENGITAIYRFYVSLLEASLRNDKQIMIGVILAFIFTMMIIFPRIGSELIPEMHQGTFYIDLTYPVGTPVEKNDQTTQAISDQISSLRGVQSLSYYSGITNEDLTGGEIGEHISRITINIDKTGNLENEENRLITEIRQLLSEKTDLDYQINRPVLFSFKSPIEIIIKGYNLDELRAISRELTQQIARIPGLKDVQSSVKPGYPEVVISFDRYKLSHYGLNAYDVAQLIKNKIEGNVPTKFKQEDRRIDIRVYLKDEQRQRAEQIKDIIINPGAAIPINLGSVAAVDLLSGPNEIRRINQERSAVITANLDNIQLNEGVERIYQVLQTFQKQRQLPPDFSYEFSGQDKEMKTSITSLIMALILAIFLVYIVMASQFESFLHPFLILFTIPMAVIGVFLTLFVLGIPFSVTVYIGLITLAGIVVNNAIVLVDYINTLRAKGMEKLEAITNAARVRLRPILITTSTTVLGLLPMALGLGEGAEIRTPMAITIMAGLISSTFLTLILIPLVYKRFSK
ncbi:MAG: efflux RND transporter permease subunit [Candidatus Delongbacteria bacterium]|nr:efflux RND transporter permease subunit [Candidatus Delongbacteria bacterium]